MQHTSRSDPEPDEGATRPADASPHGRLLGDLLIERGLIVPEDLEQALKTQQETGRKLGEVLVEQGCVTASALARALAEQYGVDLTQQTGFGSGLLAVMEQRQLAGCDGTATEAPAGDLLDFSSVSEGGVPAAYEHCAALEADSGSEHPAEPAYPSELELELATPCAADASPVETLSADDELMERLEAQADESAGLELRFEERAHVFTELATQDSSVVELRDRIEEERSRLEAAAASLAGREQALQEQAATLESVDALVEAQAADLAQAKAKLEQQQARSRATESAIETTGRQLAELETALDQQQLPADTSTRLEALTSKRQAFESDLDRLLQQVAAAAASLAGREQALQEQAATLESVDALVEAQAADLAQAKAKLEQQQARSRATESAIETTGRQLAELETALDQQQLPADTSTRLEALTSKRQAFESDLENVSRQLETLEESINGADPAQLSDGLEEHRRREESLLDRLAEQERVLRALEQAAEGRAQLLEFLGRQALASAGPAHSKWAGSPSRIDGRLEPHADKVLRYLDLQTLEIDYGVARLFPQWAARRHTALAIGLDRGAVVIAVADPNDTATLDAIQALVDRDTRFVVAERDVLLKAIAETYAPTPATADGR